MEDFIGIHEVKISMLLKKMKDLSIFKKRSKILRAVILWFTREDRPEDREGLLEWFFNGNIEEATEYQLNIKRRLQQDLPALFERHGDDSTFADEKNRTPLHCCISKMNSQKHCHRVSNKTESPDHELVSALCDLGASIIAVDCDGRSPLGIALSKGRMDLVRILMRSDSVNVADRNILGQTVLHILVGNYDTSDGDYQQYQAHVMILLHKGADINQPDHDGVTPVHLAVKKLDNLLLKKFNVNKGVNLNCRTKCGDDLLIIACKSLITSKGNESRALELIKWLVDLQGLPTNVKNENGFTALHYAAKIEGIDITKRLVKAGVDVHAVANDDTNALHSAAVSSNSEVMQHLIELGVDYRRRDNVYGFSLLHMAALSNEPRNCEWLVKEKRLDVDDLGKSQLTPLHLAAMLGNAKVVKKLIERGADVHRTDDKFYRTALHLASMRGRFTKLRDIVVNGHDEIKEDQSSMVDHCFNHHRLLDQNVDYEASIVALLDAGAEVNARDSHGCTALHYMTLETRRDIGSTRIMQVLLMAGVHVDVQDNECLTPPHNCVLNNNFIGLMNLLTFGANINDFAHEICRQAENHHFTGRAIVEHLMRLEVADLPIDECFDSYLDGFDYMGRPDDYSAELAKMKKRMLTDEVSLYDVLHMNFKRRSRFANSLPRDIETEFPEYYILLKSKCNEAVNRMALLEPARQAFDSITDMYWPDICIDKIFSFMSNISLRVLIDAASLTQ